MEEKRNIRYSNSFVWSFILILSILATIISVFLIGNNKGAKNTNLSNSRYSGRIYDVIDSSLYDDMYDGLGFEVSQDEIGIDYYIRSYKIVNYPYTQEYKDKYPDNVVVSSGDDRYYQYYSRNEIDNAIRNGEDIESFYGISKNKLENSNYYKTEEPEYKTSYLSNNFTNKKVDPQEIQIDDANGKKLFVKGYYENGNINFTETNIDNNKLDKRDVNLFIKSLKYVYKNIDSEENGIKKINFAYSFDPNSAYFSDLKESANYSNMVLSSIVLVVIGALLIATIFAISMDYKKSYNLSFYQGLVKFPIEIVIMACIAWGFALGMIAYSYNDFNIIRELGINLKSYTRLAFIAEFILVFTGSIACIYLINSIKSIYNEESKAKLIDNSIIVRIYRSISRFFKRIFSSANDGMFKLANKDYRKYAIAIYIALLLLGFIACNSVVQPGFGLIVFILWAILVTLAFKFLKKFIDSVSEINEVTKSISSGNYDVKISDQNQFESIRENVNTITNNLDEAIENAVKSERLKTELITNVSHDLKTPLTSIINYSELIRDDKLDKKEINKYSEIIHNKSLKLKSLIDDLFEVSKVASNNVELNLEKIDFKALVEQVVGEWEDKLKEKNLDIQFKSPDQAVILNLDGDKTSRIIDNLMSNIYKYALENTRIYIDLKNEGRVNLTIKNISKYPLNISASELIERFTRGDESRNTPGSGLGLSIASSLVNAQGGSFEIDIDGDLFKTSISF